MTREEAINEISSWDFLNEKEIEAIQTLIPELRESEDEIHRKWILEYLYDGLRKADEQFKDHFKSAIDWLEKQKGQKPAMIQWTGKNLKEVIDFTGKSQKFGEWFKSWEDYENYVHNHGDIFKLFCEDGSHYEVPVGAWIVKTPDGYNITSRFRFIQKPAEWCFPYGKDETVDKLIAIAECLEMDGDTLFNGYKGTECGKLLRDLARKQVECKPAGWSEEEGLISLTIAAVEDFYDKSNPIRSKIINLLKSLRPQPKQELSEEDERILKGIIGKIDHDQTYGASKGEMLSFLNRIHPGWKPSEEQMNCLCAAVDAAIRKHNESVSGYKPARVLKSLYEQLEKLM